MRKGKYDRSIKKACLEVVLKGERAYLVVSLKKNSVRHPKAKDSQHHKCIQQQKSRKNLYYCKPKHNSSNKLGTFRKAGNPATNIMCNYDKELQKENIILKKQNKFLYNYIRVQEEEKTQAERNKRVRRNLFGMVREDSEEEEEKPFRFAETLTSTRP